MAFRCIYSLMEQETSTGEHILQNFLGAKRTSKEIVSNELQKAFGEGIDLDFARALQVIHNLIGTQGGRGGDAPTLRGLSTSGGQKVNLLPGGRVQMAAPVLVEVDLPDGQKQMKVTVANEKQLDWAIAQIKEKYPKTVIDRDALLASAKLAEGYINDPVMHQLNLGGPEFFRGLLKSCFNLLGASSPERALLPCFDGVRAYIRDGTGDAAEYARWYGLTELPALPKVGAGDHHIFIVNRGSSVEGIAQLFGALNYPFRLTDEYIGPAFSCGYVVDPFRESSPAELWQPLFDYKAVPVFVDQEDDWNAAVSKATETAIGKIMELHFDLRRRDMITRSLKEVLRSTGSNVITNEVVTEFSDLVAKRVLRLPRDLGPFKRK